MEFTGEIAAIQQRLAATQEMAARRLAVVEALSPRRGERVLEVGCGAGLLLRDVGLSVGPHGLAAGVDISADQIEAAALAAEGVPAVKAEQGDMRALDYPEGVFDAAIAVQVLEYVDDVAAALAELRRVLKPGGRLLVLATNWDSAFWHGAEPALTQAMLAEWRHHAPHPNLPATLSPLLAAARFRAIRQLPVPIVNPSLHENAFAYWIARLMAAQAVDGPGAAWLAQLEAAEVADEFFFSSVPILTTATAG